jgi:hypothetical protein
MVYLLLGEAMKLVEMYPRVEWYRREARYALPGTGHPDDTLDGEWEFMLPRYRVAFHSWGVDVLLDTGGTWWVCRWR